MSPVCLKIAVVASSLAGAAGTGYASPSGPATSNLASRRLLLLSVPLHGAHLLPLLQRRAILTNTAIISVSGMRLLSGSP